MGQEDWDIMARHVLDTYPNEAVGLLASRDDQMTAGYLALLNEFQGRVFAVAPRSLDAALTVLANTDRWPLVFCHSHPDGLAQLSVDDRRNLTNWPALIGVSAVTAGKILDFRVYRLNGLAAEEVPVFLG